MADSLIGKRVLVTGCTGFVGQVLCRALAEKGAFVHGLARTAVPQPWLAGVSATDLLDKSAVMEVVRAVRPACVIHLAGIKARGIDFADFDLAYQANLGGSLNLVAACSAFEELEKFVFLGSCEEYGVLDVPFAEESREAPVTAYAITKLAVTQVLQSLWRGRHFPAVILRPSVIYGPGQQTDMFLPALIKALVAGGRFRMSAGEQTRDFIHVEDVVAGILSAMRVSSVSGKVLNLSSAKPVYIRDVALKAAQLIGEGALERLELGAIAYRPGESMTYWASNDLARESLGWVPKVSLDEGLAQTIAHYRVLLGGIV